MTIDSTIISAVIGAAATVIAALIPFIRRRNARHRKSNERHHSAATGEKDRHSQTVKSVGSGATVIQATGDVVIVHGSDDKLPSPHVEVLRQIALAKGQRTSAELLAQQFGNRRCDVALTALEQEGLIRSFRIDKGVRFTITEQGRRLLVEKSLL